MRNKSSREVQALLTLSVRLEVLPSWTYSGLATLRCELQSLPPLASSSEAQEQLGCCRHDMSPGSVSSDSVTASILDRPEMEECHEKGCLCQFSIVAPTSELMGLDHILFYLTFWLKQRFQRAGAVKGLDTWYH